MQNTNTVLFVYKSDYELYIFMCLYTYILVHANIISVYYIEIKNKIKLTIDIRTEVGNGEEDRLLYTSKLLSFYKDENNK